MTNSDRVSRQTEPWRPKSNEMCRRKYDFISERILKITAITPRNKILHTILFVK